MVEMGGSGADQITGERPGHHLASFLLGNFQRLPAYKRLFFDYGSSLICMNSMACGIAANNFFRASLKVRKHLLRSALPVVAVPSMFIGIYHEMIVTRPLIQGKLACPLCAMTRGALIGVFIGGVAPVFLAGCINLTLAPNAQPTPVKGNLFQEILSFVRPGMNRIKHLLLLQCLTSVFVASRQVAIVEDLLLMPPVPETQEELPE